MQFKYANSPKETSKVFTVDEVSVVQETHPKGKKIDIQKTAQNLIDMRHLLFIIINNRTFVFSAHNRAD